MDRQRDPRDERPMSREQHKPDPAASSDQLKREIDQTRERMDHTLDVIRERVHPDAMMQAARDWALSSFRSMRHRAASAPKKAGGDGKATAQRAGSATWGTIRTHPVSISLVGTAIGCWIYERYRASSRPIPREAQPVPQRTAVPPGYPPAPPAPDIAATSAARARTPEERRAAEEEVERAYSNRPRSSPPPPDLGHGASQSHGSQGSRISVMTEQARSGMHRITETTSRTGRQAGQRMQALAQRASGAWESTRGSARETAHRSSQTVRDHPIAVAAGALGIGMLLGVVVRESRREQQMLGEQARAAQQRMQEAGREAVQRGQEVAENTWEATRETAEREGLTPEGLKEKAEHVVEEAGDTAKHETERETEQRERQE